MIVLVTDFGLDGPYVGQMQAVLATEAPQVPVVNLFADVPTYDAKAAAYLLAAYAPAFPRGSVFLCVVDPGVGSDRLPVVLEADGQWFVGPGNGLFEIVARRVRQARWFRIAWVPARLSASFHGRDLFAPVAARIARGERTGFWGEALDPAGVRQPDWPEDLAEVVYVDGYGNALTGLRAAAVPASATLRPKGGRPLPRVRTFADVPPGDAFCYENSNGLLEIAVNRGRADVVLGLQQGTPVSVVPV